MSANHWIRGSNAVASWAYMFVCDSQSFFFGKAYVMTNGATAGAGAAAAGAAIAQAIKASGAIVRVGPDNFMEILRRSERPLVVCATGGIFSTNYQYLTSYLAFFTKSPTELMLPASAEIVRAKKIWIPA